ncbi:MULTISPECIES: NAD-dependent succinate-semialdehyde dehydrogenase [Paenibacillus]|uniref:NAD-dependent succinate-semialdehyde dehydrogenase n=1 Tax=Paenibacillus TaxID=44249 RepID=UPI00020D662E|nr:MULTISPECIES: NAD-dependent succinate-semialdehyde dehydrogenase [Paenibacillus]EGL19103.1 succinate-semialdehyde dehydrogenase [Paenibacillus sp. HGF7]EPD81095.1 succinate-semialdehyde dehydrogenase [Paenibacillus sp. HGH0039]MBV6714981.1 NAD-dependent succinate-semialdehyde dehydrogenase [Paenibacillus chitinolyticus]
MTTTTSGSASECWLNYVNGQWIEADSGKTISVVNPSTLGEIATVPDSGEAETKAAIEAAHAAFQSWSTLSAYERSDILMRWYHLLMRHQEDLAETMTAEQGKPLSEAKGEITYAASFISWYAEEAKRLYGDIIPATSSGKRMFVLRQPVGVVAAITPWNFPAAMITRKVGPALAAGCTCIVKPAEQTPLTALYMAKLAEEAGIPAGVLNIVTGEASVIGDTLFADSRVAKVTFTGSTEVGKHIMRASADTMKKISLELGGHAPVIVLDDADVELAAEQTLLSKFRNAGQTCVCANRIYVQKGIRAAFENLLADKIRALKVGDGMDPDSAIGPVIDEDGLNKIQKHVSDAVERGATVITGGSRKEVPEHAGYFFEPTLLTGVTGSMLIMKEETFGPVAPIVEFTDPDDAVRQANDSPFGLASYVFTSNINHAIRLAERLQYGIVGVNDGLPSSAQAPFGGMKESGLGREGGKYGIEEYVEIKYISLGLY